MNQALLTPSLQQGAERGVRTGPGKRSGKLTATFSSTWQPNCPICGKRQRSNYHSHLGQVHNEVEKFLPEVARIPGKTQAQVRPSSTHFLEENDQDSFLDSEIESCPEKKEVIEEVRNMTLSTLLAPLSIGIEGGSGCSSDLH